MHILFTLDDYRIGGVTSFVKQYTKILQQHNIKCTVIGFQYDIDDPASFFETDDIIIIPRKISTGLLGKFRDFVVYRNYVNKILEAKETSIVHFSTSKSTLSALSLRRIWNIKKIVTFYGAVDLESKSFSKILNLSPFQRSKEYIVNIYRRYLQWFILLSVNEIIVFSKYSRNLIGFHYQEKLLLKTHIVPGAIDTKQIGSLPINKKKVFTLINFGRAEPRKGIDLLLKTASILRTNDINFNLKIASPVEYLMFPQILLLYESLNLSFFVHFLHKATDNQKKRLLMQADLFVMPSKELETFGLTILESLSFGVPVIGTPIGAIPEILSKVDTRLISKKTDPESIADTILWYYNLDQLERNKIRVKAIKACKKYFNPSHLEKKLFSVYKI